MLSTAPAVRDVGALGLLTDRVKVEFSEILFDLGVVLSCRNGGLEPLGETLPSKAISIEHNRRGVKSHSSRMSLESIAH